MPSSRFHSMLNYGHMTHKVIQLGEGAYDSLSLSLRRCRKKPAWLWTYVYLFQLYYHLILPVSNSVRSSSGLVFFYVGVITIAP